MDQSASIPPQWVGWNSLYESAYGKYYTKSVLNFIFENLKNPAVENKTILDIGGGMGRFALPLIEKGFQVTINDIDQDVISLMQNKYPNMRFIHGDFYEKNIPVKYDIVISVGAIKCMNTPINFLIEKIYDVLQPSGKIIIENLNPDSLRRKYGKRVLKNCTFPTEVTPDVLQKTLESCGFKKIKMKSFSILTPPVKVDLPFFVTLAEFIETRFKLNNLSHLGTQYLTYAEK